ncbi:MAG: enoyl-CoA hydratase/isomerase family protein [Clostridiales Family XIII bacterium]|jgi:enoyl-CoA hydratase|nr:enoyl-CoA hydratase/isomerase family protein [Clostridiales Family XIII bacterium]
MNNDPVKLSIDGHIAVVTVDRPPVNPLNKAVMDGLRNVFTELADNNDVWVVILTGAGEKAFVAGADIKEFPEWTPDIAEDFTEKGQRIFAKIENHPTPVIAAINGVALGGGLELALACDIRLASDNAKMGLPEVSLGIIPGYGGTQRLCKAINVGEAKKLIYSARHITAEKAYQIGLVQDVYPQAELMNEARALAEQICKNGPVAVREAKKAINYERNTWIESGLNAELQAARTVFGTADKQEGVTAFIEKRKPVFKNR